MTRRWFGRAGFGVALAMALVAAAFAMRDKLVAIAAPQTQGASTEGAAGRPAQPVRVMRVALVAMDSAETFTGTIRPQHEAALAFRVPGQLVMRLVEVGDRVKAGQVVARLDDTDARLELQAAVAELTAARTDLARASADATRNRDLFAAGHVAQSALDRSTSAEAEAQSRTDRAEQARDLAANRLSYTTLMAEAAGVVTATPAEAGQVLAAGVPVVSVAETGALNVVFALPENGRDLLTTATASATLWGREGQVYALTLRDISPDVDPVGRTYRVRMALTAPDAETALGRTMTVRLQSDGGAKVVVLPLAAVLNDGAGPAVWRLLPGMDHVERVPVQLAAIAGDVAQVRGPLATGDLVISLGAHKIDPARPVRVVETATASEG